MGSHALDVSHLHHERLQSRNHGTLVRGAYAGLSIVLAQHRHITKVTEEVPNPAGLAPQIANTRVRSVLFLGKVSRLSVAHLIVTPGNLAVVWCVSCYKRRPLLPTYHASRVL